MQTCKHAVGYAKYAAVQDVRRKCNELYHISNEQLNANITSFNIKLAPTVPAMCHYLFAININTGAEMYFAPL
jgi:hypothetical protein